MPRTTLDLDATVLTQLKRRGQADHKSLGQVASELLAGALAETGEPASTRPLRWTARPMDARVDLEDKDAVAAILDRE